MLFFNFKLQSDFDTVYNRIYEIMEGEVTSDGFWGQKERESGICFKKNVNKICGYFLEDAERNGGVKSNLPLRTVFWGKFISKDKNRFFKGVVLPHPIEFFALVVFIVALLVMGSWYALLPVVLISILFIDSYVKLIKETKFVLEVIFQ